MKNVAAIQTWQCGRQVPAPKDRAVIAVGAVYYDDGAFCESVPFTAEISWRDMSGVMDWGVLQHGEWMSLRRDLDEEVVIHWWIDVPQLPEPVNLVGGSEVGA